MEAFMYRCHPQTAKIAELVRDGAIGQVRLINAPFSFQAGFNPESRLFNNSLGGGGILDVGCYATSMSRMVAGAAQGKAFAEPTEMKGVAHLGETGVDEYAVAIAKFPGEILAQLSTGVLLNQDNSVRIYGSEGSIVVSDPWIPSSKGETTKIILRQNGKDEQIIEVDPGAGLYSLEADTVAANIENREAPAMSLEDTLGNMRMLDMWRAAIGLTYESEAPDAKTVTVANRPLARRADNNMKYSRIPGIDKDASRLIMGCDNQNTYAHASIMFDDYFERGGNVFDTAYIYGGGKQERLLGQWIKNRGVRDDVVVISKGAHTPHCHPTGLTRQLLESLERLQVEYADFYMMHRDNLEVPVGEFIDVLNEHLQAGRIRAFGGSNWSIERVEAANAYAASKGLVGFAGVSNNFSLARMVDPVWAGCIHASDAKSRAWFEKTQLPLLPWSSQARGFFVRGDREFQGDGELVRCWYSDDNFARLERVQQMSQERGWAPINIALAYVLNQPFPTFPLIGPRTLEETRTSLPGLDIELTPQELKWLNLED
jgi:aryl-alcohol dehydrogenase-like predicted oxidoreductase